MQRTCYSTQCTQLRRPRLCRILLPLPRWNRSPTTSSEPQTSEQACEIPEECPTRPPLSMACSTWWRLKCGALRAGQAADQSGNRCCTTCSPRLMQVTLDWLAVPLCPALYCLATGTCMCYITIADSLATWTTGTQHPSKGCGHSYCS